MAGVFKSNLNKKINSLIDILSFNSEIRNLAETLNRRIEQAEQIQLHVPSHPSGFTREFQKRRLSIAQAYIKIVHALESEQYEERLEALKSLVGQSFHAKTVGLPLNTARVQIALMKEAVKARDNRRRQLELINDFTMASYGQESVIRNLLSEQEIVQVPEGGNVLRDMDLGWDSHVHDSLSEGRKTPTQVLIDAFIKGISHLTLAYYDLVDCRIIREAIGAGKILGIDVSIGIEFSVGQKGRRQHFMYIPPVDFDQAEVCVNFFQDNAGGMGRFLEGLKRNAENRRQTINAIFKSFNQNHLQLLNEGFTHVDYLTLKPLEWDDLRAIVLQGQASRMHLGELLYRKFQPILHKRVLAMKFQHLVAAQQLRNGSINKWEYDQIESKYESIRKQYEELTPEFLRSTYFEDRSIVDYDSAYSGTTEIFSELARCGGDLVYIHPLEQGLGAAIHTLLDNCVYINRIETMNMRDSVKRNPNDLRLLNTCVALLNTGRGEDVMRFLGECGISDISDQTVRKACEHYREHNLLPVCGSDSTGRDPKIPGMGFMVVKSIPKFMRRHFVQSHTLLPAPISALINSKGQSDKPGSSEENIVSLGKAKEYRKNRVGDEQDAVHVQPRRFFRFMNPWLRNLGKGIIGFLPALLAFHYILGRDWPMALFFAGLWFTITFTRNVVVDLVSGSGIDLKEWEWRHVNLENATSSLFWTGFSVPILATVDNAFQTIYAHFASLQGLTYEAFRFFLLAFANGTYIATHNRIRNFDVRVIRVNFFRSILSWPFATVFSYIGFLFGIPAVVQTKFWSDFVAGLIEGTGKLHQHMVLRKRDLRELLPLLDSSERTQRITAMLDIMYIWAVRQRGETALRQILKGQDLPWRDRILTWFGRHKAVDNGNQWQNPQLIGQLREKVYRMYAEEANLQVFSRFILENFEGKEAVRLTDFVGVNYMDFLRWLKGVNGNRKP